MIMNSSKTSGTKLSIDKTIQSIFSNQISFDDGEKSSINLYACRVEAGFPSPADDFLETSLNLNDHLIEHPAATFFVRVNGDSMINAGIHHNDILIVDRSLTPKNDSVIIGVINGELTVKSLKYENGSPSLVAANPNYPPIPITAEMDFSVWGVVTSVIHQFK